MGGEEDAAAALADSINQGTVRHALPRSRHYLLPLGGGLGSPICTQRNAHMPMSLAVEQSNSSTTWSTSMCSCSAM